MCVCAENAINKVRLDMVFQLCMLFFAYPQVCQLSVIALNCFGYLLSYVRLRGMTGDGENV